MFPCKTPEPPYYAVIFPSTRTEGDNGYKAMAEKMETLAARQPGFLGIESVKNEKGCGITISYWTSEEAIVNWHHHPEHQKAQAAGKSVWYQDYMLRIAKVERAYGKDS
ncbi:MAG: antibiotic biosynthesis monooxygenase [Verrucomicrobia bacterium]|nr:antibiotic biosynthesis monooxygenase [Verrucomicrobiota bacterium]MDA1065349.1 antibiotic biosynthesis monooxygenase [Verrucomicrobiota bacterium]